MAREMCEICEKVIAEDDTLQGCEMCGKMFGNCCDSVTDDYCSDCAVGQGFEPADEDSELSDDDEYV